MVPVPMHPLALGAQARRAAAMAAPLLLAAAAAPPPTLPGGKGLTTHWNGAGWGRALWN